MKIYQSRRGGRSGARVCKPFWTRFLNKLWHCTENKNIGRHLILWLSLSSAATYVAQAHDVNLNISVTRSPIFVFVVSFARQ